LYAPGLELDHVLIAVADLESAGREVEARYGLASLEGGRHPGWGTANRIVPLGGAYLELVAVVDAAQAARNPFGRWVSRAHPQPIRLLGWAVRTHELDDVAGRLGLEVSAGARIAGDGGRLEWRLAGIEQAAAAPSLPFFIQWEDGTPLPGSAHAAHPAGSARIATLRLAGDADRLAAWLGGRRLPVAVSAGVPAVTGIVLSAACGEVVIEDGSPRIPVMSWAAANRAAQGRRERP
jgi:Glyoxalase-like domain